MATFNERLKELRNERHMSQEQLANVLGIGRSTLTNYENGKRYPKKDVLDHILDYFNVDRDYFDGKQNIKRQVDYTGVYQRGVEAGRQQALTEINQIAFTDSFVPVPVYSQISCGNGTWIDEMPEDFIGIPDIMVSKSATYFSNRASGDSMEPKIQDGDFLIFEKMPQIPSGMIGAFSLNGQYYCKRFKQMPDGSGWLFSENDRYDPIPIKPSDDFRTLGVYRIKLSKEQ